MSARTTWALIVLGLGLLAVPAVAQEAAQPEHHQGGAMMGTGHGSTMGADDHGSMMGTGGGSMMGAGGVPMMGMMRMMMGESGGMGMMSVMAGHVEGRLAFLRTELKITDAQLPLWNKFAAAVRDNAKAMGKTMPDGMIGASQSKLPDKLAMREKMMTAHLEALRKLKTAVDPLYAALTDEQKKTADEIMLGPMGMMM